ncbi:hypothetical protein GCM10028819_52610 [Spirosoma humi]
MIPDQRDFIGHVSAYQQLTGNSKLSIYYSKSTGWLKFVCSRMAHQRPSRNFTDNLFYDR